MPHLVYKLEVNMKRWITYALGILLTLVVLAGVGMAGYRMGFMQGASAAYMVNGRPPEFGHPLVFGKDFNEGGPEFAWDKGRGPFAHGFEHGRGRGHFLFPLFGLVHLIAIGLLIWLGYVLYKNSGWQFVRVKTRSESEAASDEKRPRRKTKS
jgi:hypothetical protein